MSQINIGNLTIDKFYLGDSNNVKVYLGEIKLYPSEEPQPVTNCYEVISTPISDYTSTDYSSVFSFADTKWYMLNNLSQYEQYGIYETGTSLSDFTYYPNKLAVIGETEYQYQSNGWVEVGGYIDTQTTYEVTSDSTALEGKELQTTFKIPYAEVSDAGWLNITIHTADGRLGINDVDYYYNDGSTRYNGTVTNDGEYYYYSLPSEAPSSVIIQSTNYMGSPLHLIFGSKQASVQYTEKEVPTAKVYNTVEEMEAAGCPTVGINQYGVVGDDAYQFEETEEWVNKAKSSLKFVAKYNNGNANVIVCNTSNELSSGETQPSYLSNNAMTDVYIGDCVTTIGGSAFRDCSGLTSVTIPDGVTTIGGSAFAACSGLTSVTIPNSVTSIGSTAFQGCRGLTSVTIGSGVTSIGTYAFSGCNSLTSVTIPDSVTSIGKSAFYYCRGLTSVTIGSGVTSIDSGAFQGCSSLTSVTIGSGVTSIGYSAFQDCSSLTSVTVEATTPPTLDRAVFNNNASGRKIYVPAASVNAYKATRGWSTYAADIEAIPTP